MNNLSQIAQVVINLEHFKTACLELEVVLMNLRWVPVTCRAPRLAAESHLPLFIFSAAQRGGSVRLFSLPSFDQTLAIAQQQISTVIASKLDDFFELAELDWTPAQPSARASDYIDEMIGFLNNFVDAVLSALEDDVRGETYRRAYKHIADTMIGWLSSPDIPRLNENALANIAKDVAFIDQQMRRLGKGDLAESFSELKLVSRSLLCCPPPPSSAVLTAFALVGNRRPLSFSQVS